MSDDSVAGNETLRGVKISSFLDVQNICRQFVQGSHNLCLVDRNLAGNSVDSNRASSEKIVELDRIRAAMRFPKSKSNWAQQPSDVGFHESLHIKGPGDVRSQAGA